VTRRSDAAKAWRFPLSNPGETPEAWLWRYTLSHWTLQPMGNNAPSTLVRPEFTIGFFEDLEKSVANQSRRDHAE